MKQWPMTTNRELPPASERQSKRIWVKLGAVTAITLASVYGCLNKNTSHDEVPLAQYTPLWQKMPVVPELNGDVELDHDRLTISDGNREYTITGLEDVEFDFFRKTIRCKINKGVLYYRTPEE